MRAKILSHEFKFEIYLLNGEIVYDILYFSFGEFNTELFIIILNLFS